MTFLMTGASAGAALAQPPAVGADKAAPDKKAPVKGPEAKPPEQKPDPEKSSDTQSVSKAAVPDTKSPDAKSPDEADSTPADADNAEVSGLPVPRFVSLRTDPINLRSGPGLQYPVEWVYHRRHLPVEVVAEFDTWRRIRDPDGTEGWVHQSMITGHRTGVVRGSPQALRRNDGDDGSVLATLEPGVVVNVQRCPAGAASCRVEVEGLQGWLKREQLWGVYPTETVE